MNRCRGLLEISYTGTTNPKKRKKKKYHIRAPRALSVENLLSEKNEEERGEIDALNLGLHQ